MPKRTKVKELRDAEWLQEQYEINCRSGEDIAAELGCTKYTVYRALKKHNIPIRKRTSKYPKLNDKKWLRWAYLEQKMSINEIASELGCAAGNVYSAFASAGITPRDTKEGLRVKYPEGRRGELAANWRGGKIPQGRTKPKYVKRRVGPEARNWKGGRTIASGYIYIYKPDHPNATKAGYVMEHRLVAEENLGRILEKSEIVHHINGDRQDNRWENLEVVTRSQHVSNHFGDSFEMQVWKSKAKKLEAKNAKLEAENARLKAELEKCKSG